MPTSIFSRQELDIILQALVDKVESVNADNYKNGVIADYHSVYYKISSLIDRFKFNEHYEFFLKGIDLELKKKQAELLNTRIADLALDVRSKNALLANNITFVKDLVALNPKTLKSFPHLGDRCLVLIQDFMDANYLEFEKSPDDSSKNEISS